LSAKLLLLPVFKISVLSAPEIAAALGILFNAAVVCAIAAAPTHLKARYLCAISAVLIPTATENYGILLYSVWWSGILIALALLWDTSKGLHWLRLTFLVFGGLSTPFIIAAGPLFVIRAYKDQSVRELAIVWTAVILTVICAVVGLSAPAPIPFDFNFTTDGAFQSVSKVFGMFVAPSPAHQFNTGIVLILTIIALAIYVRRRVDFYFFLLVGLLAASIGATLLRAPMAGIHPFATGARYFFLPYLFLSFTLLWLWSLVDPDAALLKAAPVAIIVAAIIGGLQHPFFIHPLQERQAWAGALQKCADTPGETVLPLGYNWIINMPQDKCRSLIDGTLLRAGTGDR